MQIADSTEMSQLGEHDVWHRVRRTEPSHLLQNISLFPFDSNCSAQILSIRTALMCDTIGLSMLGFGMISAVRLTKKHLKISYKSLNMPKLPIENKRTSKNCSPNNATFANIKPRTTKPAI